MLDLSYVNKYMLTIPCHNTQYLPQVPFVLFTKVLLQIII